MDFRTASNIYRKHWLIEGQSAIRCLDLLQEAREGNKTFSWKDEDDESEQEKESYYQKLFANSDIITAPLDTYQAKYHPGYEGKTVGILPVIGPVMKEDFCGWFGTASLKNELNKMNATDSIKSIIILMDSPGGTVDGTESFAAAIKASKKETITVVDGLMCSAGYWIGSSADKVIATAQTDMIGCIGTMIAFYDNTEAMKQRGYVLREYFATGSQDKNKDFREAKEGKDKGKLLIESTLDPLNDIFLNAVRENRGKKLNQEQTLSGKTFVAKEAMELGLIDDIMSMEDVLFKTLNKHKNSGEMKIKNIFKNIFSFLGISATTEEVELTQEQVAKIDAIIPEFDASKAKVIELETAAGQNSAKITELEGKITEAATKETALNTKITEQAAEIVKLGKMDGGTFTKTGAQEEKKGAEDVIEMSASQKELNEKAKNL